LDATITENHTRENETTDSPVEEGVDFTDHIRRKPVALTLEGIVTDTPALGPTRLDELGINTGRDGAQPEGSRITATVSRSRQALEQLEAIMAARQPITVATKLATYPNMVLTQLTIPRAAGNGDALRFSATLREVRTVKTARARIAVKVNKSDNRVKPKLDEGQKPGKPATAAEVAAVEKSDAAQALDFVMAKFSGKK
jgi:hypothetical protein